MAEEELELEEKGEGDGEDGGGKKSGGAMKFVIIGAVVAAAGGGFMVYRSMAAKPEVQAAESEPAAAPEASDGDGAPAPLLADGAVVQLDPMLVNLADDEKTRFVRVRIELVFGTQEEMESVKENDFAMAKVKHVSLSLLGTKKSSEIGDPAGQATFRKELAAELQKSLPGVKLLDILLTEFIIQY